MTLASGGHVKIGSYECILAEDQENHYVHSYENLFKPRDDIPGSPGKANLRPYKLLWSMDDWAGGEGHPIFYSNDPLVYYKSAGANPRLRGRLTGRPNRQLITTNIDTTDQRHRPIFAIGDDAVWIFGSRQASYSQNGTAWTAKTAVEIALNALSTSYKITAAVGHGDDVYYSGWHSGASGTRATYKVSRSGAATAVQSEATNKAPYVGLAVMNGRLYAWTGRKLFELDIFQSVPLAAKHARKVYDSGTEIGSGKAIGEAWWADCVAAENAVFYFTTYDAQSRVWMYRNGVPRPLWTAPLGYSIKSIKYANGVLFIAGHWGGDSNATGTGCLYAIPMDTMRPVPVGNFREHEDKNLQMQEMAVSYGNNLLVAAARNGYIFNYDADMDGISMLDAIATDVTYKLIEPTDGLTFTGNSYRIGDLIVYGKYRMAVVYFPSAGAAGTGYQLLAYDTDRKTDRQAGTATNNIVHPLESGKWDFDFPGELKALHGFHVTWDVEDTGTTSGLKTGQEIKVEYRLDNGAWTTADTLTSASSPSGSVKGRTFIAVATGSSTPKFYQMDVRVTLYGKYTGGVGYQCPIVYGLTTEAALIAYSETWDLLLRVKDERHSDPQSVPRSREWSAHKLRDYLLSLATNKNVVTFLDGYRYPKDQGGTARYSTHTVTIEDPLDIIARNGEGLMRVRLRALSE